MWVGKSAKNSHGNVRIFRCLKSGHPENNYAQNLQRDTYTMLKILKYQSEPLKQIRIETMQYGQLVHVSEDLRQSSKAVRQTVYKYHLVL